MLPVEFMTYTSIVIKLWDNISLTDILNVKLGVLKEPGTGVRYS